MPTMNATQLVTLSDVAALAHVQRPVVSMWRSRLAGTAQPFPAPVERREGRDVFDVEAVVTWLEQTGHGNNPAARQDAATAAALDLIPVEARGTALDGLVALLALKAQLGATLTGLSAPDLLDLADDVDPDDRCLYREIAALGADAEHWAAHADALASAAFTTAGALEALVARRGRLGLDAQADQAVSAPVLALVGQLAAELTPSDPTMNGALVAPFGEADLLLALGAHRGEPGTATLPVPDRPAARHARRTLIAAGWAVLDADQDGGAVEPPAGSTVLALLPSATYPHLTDAELLDALGEVEATLPPDGHAIVVGPAPVLCGRLPQTLQAARATVLRSGRVRAIIRLPAGLRPASVRQKLGLWLIGPGADDGSARDHRTALADLSGTPLDDAAIDDLVTDLLAAAPGSPGPRAHAFRFARLATTTTVIATSGDLVSVTPPGHRPRTAPTVVATALVEGYTRAAALGPTLVPWQIVPGEPAGPTLVPLGRLIELGHLRLIPGNRLDQCDLSAASGVPVHTTGTLTADSPRRPPRIDRLHLAAAYPHSRDTEPGDVVFCTTPRPAAVLDHDGLSLVAAPARALRVTPSAPPGLLPEVVAHAIRTATGVGDWRLWPVPVLPATQADHARHALAEIDHARTATTARLTALDGLTDRLIEGTSTGTVTLLPPTRTTQMEG